VEKARIVRRLLRADLQASKEMAISVREYLERRQICERGLLFGSSNRVAAAERHRERVDQEANARIASR